MLEGCLSKLQKGNPGGRELAGVGHLLKMQAALQHVKSKQPWEPVEAAQSIGVEGVPNKHTWPLRNVLNSSLLLFPDTVSAWCSLHALALLLFL